jgi:hypothetical protein
VSPSRFDDAYAQWQSATRTLVGGPEQLRELQNRRYAFASSVGELLTRAEAGQQPVQGPALYGVECNGPGLIYIGQTLTAQRRLRDLAVGESHHLANTVPPEIWDRVVVVTWPNLLVDLSARDRATVEAMPASIVGEALEHLLQLEFRPLLNQRRRGSGGQWRDRQPATSQSRGSMASPQINSLYQAVRETWTRLRTTKIKGTRHVEAAGRVIFPAQLLR